MNTQLLETLTDALYGDSPIADAWRTAAQPDAPGYLMAIRALIANRQKLQGSVFVQTPSDFTPAWNGVLGATEAMCGCGQRRLLLPAQRRQVPILSESNVYALDPGGEVYLAPWGGDLPSAYLKLTHADGMLVMESTPFMSAQACAAWKGSSDTGENIWRQPLTEIRKTLQLPGEFHLDVSLLNEQRIEVGHPVCSVVSVKIGEGGDDVYIAPDVSVWPLTDPAATTHICE